MPYVSDSNLDEKEESSQGNGATAPAGQVSGQPNAVSGGAGAPAPAQSTNSATQAPAAPTLASGSGFTNPVAGSGAGAKATPTYDPAAPTSSGQWTNLQNYLSANNGAQFGSDFSGKVGNDVNQAKTAVTNAGTNFEGAVDAGTIQNNQDILGEVNTAPDKMSADDQTAFEKQLNGSYTGPQSTANDKDFQDASSQAHSAFSETQQAQTPGGQQALLQKFYNTPTYTPGEQSLDSALLSSDPNAQAALQSLAAQGSNLPVSYQAAETKANNEAASGVGNSNAANQAATEALYGVGGSATNLTGGAIGNIQNAITGAVTSDNTSRDAEWAQLQSDLSRGIVTSDDEAYLAGQGAPQLSDRNYGINDYSPYISEELAATNNSAATKDQAAQLAALASLSGQDNTFLSDPTQAGTYDPTRAVTFDATSPNGYNTAVANAQRTYENQLAGLNAQIAQLTPMTVPNNFPDGGAFPDVAKANTIAQQYKDQIAGIQAQIRELNNQYGGTVAGTPYNVAGIEGPTSRTPVLTPSATDPDYLKMIAAGGGNGGSPVVKLKNPNRSA